MFYKCFLKKRTQRNNKCMNSKGFSFSKTNKCMNLLKPTWFGIWNNNRSHDSLSL